MRLIDSHAHYNDRIYDNDLQGVILNNKANNVDKIINIGYNIESSLKSIELSKQYKGYIYAAIGIHPNDISNSNICENIEKIYNEIDNKEYILAIGETGLDYHYDNYDKEIQKEQFIKHIELANKLDLPVIIHSRDAEFDTIELLKSNKPNKAVLHSFSGSIEFLKFAINNGYMISIGGPVTYTNAKRLQEIVKDIPIDRLMIETDCPYLTPHPFRGTRNDSSKLNYIIEKIADIKEIEKEKLADVIYENTIKFFNINI